jgi:hypothetical protein
MRNLQHVILGAIAALALGSCANFNRNVLEADYQASVPTCRSGEECKGMWSTAKFWVLKNATLKMRIADENLIETYQPNVEAGSQKIAKVWKEPIGTDAYKILVLVQDCYNLYCSGQNYLSAIDFNRAVKAASIQ